MKKVLIMIISVIVLIGIYIKIAMDNITYTFSISGLNVKTISFKKDSVVNVGISIVVTNKNFFPIKIKSLKYEVFYNGNLLAKSADTKVNNKPIRISSNGNTTFSQEVEVHPNDSILDIGTKMLTNQATNYKINVYANILGIDIKLKGIEYKYQTT